ncbi:MAG: diacylglycerol kinase family lipid kinase [Methylacidiphilales bacterium]|nr:diacylglycerol kinase family lipid kinase [Candidatus Methylacidiphilales bacterium]
MNRANSEICIILNPSAKGERARNLADKLRRSLPEARVLLTRYRGHAEELARQSVRAEYSKIVAAGGDGTINEVVNGIAGARGVALGILPVGTVNVFAMELGIPSRMEAALEIVTNGHTRNLDLARANNRYFVQLAGVGFDAEAVKATDLNFKKVAGPLSYLLAATQVAAQKPPLLQIRWDQGHVVEGCFMLVGNGRYYGGPFQFFPEADMQDGKLDVCVFKKRTHFDLLRYFQGIVSGTHTKFDDVAYFKARHISVTADRRVPLEVDGELAGEIPVEFSIKKQALKVLVPE